MKAYIINLDSRTDRLAKISADMSKIGQAWERVSAVDLSEKSLAKYVSKLRAFARLGGVLPSRGQVGCYYSHRKIWQMMLDNNIPVALILEDDAVPDNFDPAILQIDLQQIQLDMLRLEFSSNPVQYEFSDAQNLLNRKVVFAETWGSGAYIITAQGAKKCLCAGKFWFVVDDYRIWSSIYGLKTALLQPQMFRQRDIADTDIVLPQKFGGIGRMFLRLIARHMDGFFLHRERERILKLRTFDGMEKPPE